jgi:prepilin-type N-terminal cleavage/methylation domain-containing protein
MRTRPNHPTYPIHGFTLIELIGVLAIMTILAGVIEPNALRSIERAAVRAETQTLTNLGEQVELYLRDNGTLPSSANWITTLAAYSELSPTDLALNKRNNPRVFLLDPGTFPAQRVMILSSMREGLNLPTSGNINNAARFRDIWDTPDQALPTSASWGGWNAWRNVTDSAEYLAIQRINLVPIYRTAFEVYTVTLNNNSTVSCSYNLIQASGAAQSVVNIPAGATAILTNLRAKERINLYRTSGGTVLDYAYVVSDSGKTLDFDGVRWLPQ